jgi:hypothetical protein
MNVAGTYRWQAEVRVHIEQAANVHAHPAGPEH